MFARSNIGRTSRTLDVIKEERELANGKNLTRGHALVEKKVKGYRRTQGRHGMVVVKRQKCRRPGLSFAC